MRSTVTYSKSFFRSRRRGLGLYMARRTFSLVEGVRGRFWLSRWRWYSRSLYQSLNFSAAFVAAQTPMLNASRCFSFRGVSSSTAICMRNSRNVFSVVAYGVV